MKRGGKRRKHIVVRSAMAGFALLVLVAGSPGITQTIGPSAAGPASVGPPIQNVPGLSSVFREIFDPHSHERWVLLRDVVHSGGPGRLVPAKPEGELSASANRRERNEGTPGVVAPCIHVGDKVVVEERTPAADVYLEAVAMEPAVAESMFHVRLKIGGTVLRAVALAPGKAGLALPTEAAR